MRNLEKHIFRQSLSALIFAQVILQINVRNILLSVFQHIIFPFRSNLFYTEPVYGTAAPYFSCRPDGAGKGRFIAGIRISLRLKTDTVIILEERTLSARTFRTDIVAGIDLKSGTVCQDLHYG